MCTHLNCVKCSPPFFFIFIIQYSTIVSGRDITLVPSITTARATSDGYIHTVVSNRNVWIWVQRCYVHTVIDGLYIVYVVTAHKEQHDHMDEVQLNDNNCNHSMYQWMYMSVCIQQSTWLYILHGWIKVPVCIYQWQYSTWYLCAARKWRYSNCRHVNNVKMKMKYLCHVWSIHHLTNTFFCKNFVNFRIYIKL